MAELPIPLLVPSSTPLRAKPTLATLPVDIKHEIFSYLLLGKNVKYFKPGTVPGFAYAFQINIARTSKEFYKEADAYLRAHNNFALVHLKYPRLIHNFCPHVAVGSKARSFINPTIEATVQDLEPKGVHPDHDLQYCMGSAKARVERILFLAQDLPHFCQHLQLEIHIWPSSQIYIHPDRDQTSTLVQYSPIIVKNRRKIVWKVKASHRSDLTLQERRTRQQSLISSISAVVGHNLDVHFLGVEQDIAAQAITRMTPRIVSVDAAGWNLLENMQNQKRHLDESLVRGPQGSKELRRAYVMVAQMVESSRSWLPTIIQYNPAFLLNTPYRRTPPPPVSMMSFQSDSELCAMASPWFRYAYITALECLLNAMSLALDDSDFGILLDTCNVAWTMGWIFQFHGLLPQELCGLASHYHDWQDLFSGFFTGTVDLGRVREIMAGINGRRSTTQADNIYYEEDRKFLQNILLVSLLMETNDMLSMIANLWSFIRADLLMIYTIAPRASNVVNVPSPIRSSSVALLTCTAGHPTLLTTSALNSRRASSNTRMLPSKVRRLLL
jgi:hypothetical protein